MHICRIIERFVMDAGRFATDYAPVTAIELSPQVFNQLLAELQGDRRATILDDRENITAIYFFGVKIVRG